MADNVSISDLINVALLVATTIGVFAAFRQIWVSNKQKRADIILQLCNQFYQDKEMQDMYYKIEYSRFQYKAETFHASEEEKQLDKLLGLFSNIGQLYQMKIINDRDLEFIKYEFQIIYEYRGVQLYFQTLDGWFQSRQITHLKFQPFRDVGQIIVDKNNKNGIFPEAKTSTKRQIKNSVETMEEIDLLKELTSGFSAQAKTSNKYWGLLMLVSIISVLNYSNSDNSIGLPFNLGEVTPVDFHSIVLLMICALAIAFASAWLQQVRTRDLIQRVIDNTPEDRKYIHKVHIQDIFDSTASQTFNRVSPIAQVLQGKFQFFSDGKSNQKGRLMVSIVIYALLKVIVAGIIFVIPVMSLLRSVEYFSTHSEENSWGIPIFFYWMTICATFLVFLVMIIFDLKYIRKTMLKISLKE